MAKITAKIEQEREFLPVARCEQCAFTVLLTHNGYGGLDVGEVVNMGDGSVDHTGTDHHLRLGLSMPARIAFSRHRGEGWV